MVVEIIHLKPYQASGSIILILTYVPSNLTCSNIEQTLDQSKCCHNI